MAAGRGEVKVKTTCSVGDATARAGARRGRGGGKKLAQRDKGMLAVGINESRSLRDCLAGCARGGRLLNALPGVGKVGQEKSEW
jgi:hypothetical protein